MTDQPDALLPCQHEWISNTSTGPSWCHKCGISWTAYERNTPETSGTAREAPSLGIQSAPRFPTPTSALHVEFENGKYAIVEDRGRVMLLRHGELWENGPPFAKLFITIAHEVDALRKRQTQPSTTIPVRDAEPMTSEPKAKAASEAEQGVQLSRPEPTPPSALELRYHSAMPGWCKIIGLKIKAIPECEGGGFAVKREQAEAIVRALLASRPQESAGDLVEKAKAFDEAAMARDEAGFLGSPAECIRYLLALVVRLSAEGGGRGEL